MKQIYLIVAIMSFGYLVCAREMRFVIIVPSYNNEQWVQKNLESIFSQDYPYFRVIYINDASQDRTGQLVQAYIQKHCLADICTYIENKKNKGALYNLYHAIHSCADEEVIVMVDGDDWLAHSTVLKRVALEYHNPDVWLTYGQYIHSNTKYGEIGCCTAYTSEEIEANNFRKVSWRASHLRTFYAKLFKLIAYNDLRSEGQFFKVTWDLAMMFPMLEMAQERHRFIPDILYVYNVGNPLNDFRRFPYKQIQRERYIRKNLKPYTRIESLWDDQLS